MIKDLTKHRYCRDCDAIIADISPAGNITPRAGIKIVYDVPSYVCRKCYRALKKKYSNRTEQE